MLSLIVFALEAIVSERRKVNSIHSEIIDIEEGTQPGIVYISNISWDSWGIH